MKSNLTARAFAASALLLAACENAERSSPTSPVTAPADPCAGPRVPRLLRGAIPLSDSLLLAHARIVVANRASGTVSVIDPTTDRIILTEPLPPGPNAPEPMYVVAVPALRRVLVGDRANSRVVVFDARTFEVIATVPTAPGTFHMWADARSSQLWVANDVAQAMTVIDLTTLRVLITVQIPADLAAIGGRPHDVMLNPHGCSAFVTVTGVQGASDVILKYSTETFAELNRAFVGKVPHVGLFADAGELYVPSERDNRVQILSSETFDRLADLPLPGAHGVGVPSHEDVFYTTNLPGGGSNGLFVIDTRTRAIIGSVDTPIGVPHNIAITPNGGKLYVTHSGVNDKVTVYSVTRLNPIPRYERTIVVGANPFGIAYVH